MDAKESQDYAMPAKPPAVSQSSSSFDLRSSSERVFRPPAPPALLPWPARLLVFLALAALAVLAIRIIDRHAMAKMPTEPFPKRYQSP